MLIKYLIGLHSLALYASMSNSLFLSHKISLVVLIIISLAYYLNQAIDFKYVFLRYSAENGWEIAYLENQFHGIKILSSTVLTSNIVFFNFKTQNDKKKAILICKDALSVDQYRQLMVELKISGLKKGDL